MLKTGIVLVVILTASVQNLVDLGLIQQLWEFCLDRLLICKKRLVCHLVMIIRAFAFQ